MPGANEREAAMRVVGVACLAIIALNAAPASAQSCGKGEMATPNGCIRVCPPGDYVIAKKNGFDTCERVGNQEVGAHHKKYALLPIAAGKDVDGICFGIREDERVETVVDDRFVEAGWHVDPHHAYVAEISYTLDPGLAKLHLTGFRYWRPDADNKPAGVGDMVQADAVVPLFETPQPKWPCSEKQWASIMTPPKVTSVAPDFRVPDLTRSPSGRCWYFQREVFGPYGFVTCR
jgi:hypothetical protein